MLKNILATLLLSLSLILIITLSQAICEEQPDNCPKLEEKYTGNGIKYSMYADVDGMVSYAELLCGIKLRANKLCAMEMVKIDASAKVYDFYSNKEIEMTNAFFVINPKSANHGSVSAFGEKESAKKFATETGGETLDFNQLVEKYTVE